MRPLILTLFLAGVSIASDSPAFFCFVKPENSKTLQLKEIGSTRCTHFVYGDISVDSGRLQYRSFDLLTSGSEGLIRQFQRLRNLQKDAKYLLGLTRSTPIRNAVEARTLAETILNETMDRHFDGVFLTFDGHQMDDLYTTQLLESLASHKELLPPTVRMTAQRVWQGRDMERLRMALENVQYFYIDMGVVLTNEDPLALTEIDVINATKRIFAEDTIQGTLNRLSEVGVQESQIVVGLTAGGWQFDVADSMTSAAGGFAVSKGRRITHQEACKLRGSIRFQPDTLNEVVVYKSQWTVVNHLHPNGLGRKIEYIVSKGVAGVGLSSFEDDDVDGICQTDPLPAHRLTAEYLHKGLTTGTARCTRLCYLDSTTIQPSFPFDSLHSDFCSHVIIGGYDIDLKDTIIVPRETNILLQRVELWRAKMENPPKLILSLGANQQNDVWALMLSNELSRDQIVADIQELIKRDGFDGVELSWTREGPKGDFDARSLESLIVDLVEKKDDNKEVFVAVTAEATLANFYNMTLLNLTTDMVVVHTHRLHSDTNPMTGHQSSFSVSATSVAKNNVRDVIGEWVRGGLPRRKIAMSVSAKALSMNAIGTSKSSADLFGRPVMAKLKAMPNEINSQQMICEALLTGKTQEKWVPQLSVPYLLDGDQFVTYDNQKSIRMKTRWASVEGISIAVHDLAFDDPHAMCTEKKPFPILSEVVKQQMCRKCLYHEDFLSCTHEFAVSCSFDLEKSSPIFRTRIIPFEQCTELVIEHATLNSEGEIKFTGDDELQVIKNITEMRSKMLKCGSILTLKSFISDRLFSKLLLEKRQTTINNIVNYMEQNNFTGVNLDLENVVKRANNVHFNNFLSELMSQVTQTKADNGCDRTVSIRFGTTSHSQSSVYRMSTLNKLHRVSIGITDNKMDKNLLPTDNSTVSADEIIKRWRRRGLKSSQILLEMSPYGYLEGELGEPLSQGNICELVGNKAPRVFNFDTMMTTVTSGSDPVRFPQAETFAYKIGYAQREGLGGISVKSVNGDDYNGVCGLGSFPILKSIYKTSNCEA